MRTKLINEQKTALELAFEQALAKKANCIHVNDGSAITTTRLGSKDPIFEPTFKCHKCGVFYK